MNDPLDIFNTNHNEIQKWSFLAFTGVKLSLQPNRKHLLLPVPTSSFQKQSINVDTILRGLFNIFFGDHLEIKSQKVDGNGVFTRVILLGTSQERLLKLKCVSYVFQWKLNAIRVQFWNNFYKKKWIRTNNNEIIYTQTLSSREY